MHHSKLLTVTPLDHNLHSHTYTFLVLTLAGSAAGFHKPSRAQLNFSWQIDDNNI